MVPAEVSAAKIATVMATEVAAMMAAEIVTLVVTLVMAVMATVIMVGPLRIIDGGGHRDRIETVGRHREWGIAAPPPRGCRELIGGERDQHGYGEYKPDHTDPPS
jgi:hypothetical protein